MIGAAAIAGALLCEQTSDEAKERTTLSWTDEQIMTLPYFEIVASGDENRNMPCDIKGYSIGDGFIHLLLPDSVPEKAVVIYIMDGYGNNLARRVCDFTGQVMIGPWTVLLEHHALPAVYFTSDIPGSFDVMVTSETKDITCEGNIRICLNGEVSPAGDVSDTHVTLRGRGSTSWSDASSKRSCTLSLDKPQNLLGLGKNRNWNLIGNAFDRSLVRNVTFNKMSRDLGIEYQPNMQNVNLYADGVYRGVYTLTTKVSVDKDRVALRFGDYMYRLDPSVPEFPIPYTSTTWFKDSDIDYPVADLVYPQMPEDVTKATLILQNFINVRDDPLVPGFDKICDLRNLAKYYWIQEITMNYDACSRSTYLYYKGSEGMIRFGPVWDMDLTLGVTADKQDVDFGEPMGWKIRELGWYKSLFQRPEFVEIVNDEYYNGGVRDAMLDGAVLLSEQRAHLGNDAYLDFLFYKDASLLGFEYPFGDTYDEYCDNMIAFYQARADWIDGQMSR